MTLWTRAANNPVLLSGFLVAAVNLFVADKEQATSYSTLIQTGLPLLLALLVRSQVSGPVTSKRMASSIVNPPASQKGIEAAEKVLEGE